MTTPTAESITATIDDLIATHERLHSITTTSVLIVPQAGEFLVDGNGVLRLPRALAEILAESTTIPATLLGLPVTDPGEGEA